MVIESLERIIHTWGQYPASPPYGEEISSSMGYNNFKDFTGFNSPSKGLKKSANLKNEEGATPSKIDFAKSMMNSFTAMSGMNMGLSSSFAAAA